MSKPENAKRQDLPEPIVVIGEVLWDVFPESVSLGGAPLNFAVHAQRLGHHPVLISALGTDELGQRAAREIAGLSLDTRMLRCSSKWKTGKASVRLDSAGNPTFEIDRPAAYDDVRLSETDLDFLRTLEPSWLYFGTLFPSQAEARSALHRVMESLPHTRRFYDVNLRPGFDSLELVATLLAGADVVKLNESEAEAVAAFLGLPSNLEGFCRRGSERFRWTAVCITLGARGCAMLRGSEFVRAEGYPVSVADTVGAGDAFAAAFLHGLIRHWSLPDVAEFSNRVGALIASRTGAIPEWSLAEATNI